LFFVLGAVQTRKRKSKRKGRKRNKRTLETNGPTQLTLKRTKSNTKSAEGKEIKKKGWTRALGCLTKERKREKGKTGSGSHIKM